MIENERFEGERYEDDKVVLPETLAWDEIKQYIEAIIFASDEVVTVKFISNTLEGVSLSKDDIAKAVNELNEAYVLSGRSFYIESLADGFRFLSRKEFSQIIKKMLSTKIQKKLSQAALETLAIIAYKQPVSKPDIEHIRGTSVDYVMRTLMQKELIEVIGRSDAAGKALLYGTTKTFLEYFKLNTLADLPKLREIEQILKDSDTEMLIKERNEISDCGIASRRQADKLLAGGKILVNHAVVDRKGVKIVPGIDKIIVNGRVVKKVEKKKYLVLNKPKNVITTVKDEQSRETVMSYIDVTERVYPVGRLDRNTTGVLLFTNDGELAKRLMSPKFLVKKEYIALLDHKISEKDLIKLRNGMRLKDTGEKILPCEANIEETAEHVWISITQGKNHQVKRMFWSVGYDVRKLSRISYGGILLKGLKRGQFRHLTKDEIIHLHQLVNLEYHW
ncbi:hypothetical protein CHS0354_024119 [Potamilus streckersoni]|uniref:Pseudouridine synthase RsuA/RluA-like domain-containing protein n=1 Tax=Potamilus streckersoni TaxID=2493646 RepID=A0AAE0S087_9BIVA|nr:hypothetical protein CHS0354_024119 [Potamilus streckersoni]